MIIASSVSVPVVSRGKPRRLRAPTFGAVLDKGTTIACALRLVAKHHRSAEPVIIMVKEH